MSLNPIADLSYRNYDGPLESPNLRWWVIARVAILQAFSKKIYWVATAFAGWYYLAMIAILFFMGQLAESAPQGAAAMKAFMDRIVWKDQFLHGFSFAQLVILLTALLLGSGAIANDNRANALLVYLSKPCTKADYVVGKWVGIFVPLVAMMALPTAVFYLYGALSYTEYGFISENVWLAPKMVLVILLSAALHSSLVLAISSFFNQGRIAGATYAGIYFLASFFTKLMQLAWVVSRGEAPGVVKTLFYFSIDGIQIGLAKAILATDGSMPFGIQAPGRAAAQVPAPPLLPFFVLVVGVTAVSMLFTWRRVHAVEVVG